MTQSRDRLPTRARDHAIVAPIARRRGSVPRSLAACLLVSIASIARTEPTTGDLADLSLEQLGNIEITSVSRRAERLSGAAASIYVITAQDIRRSGATSIPEALRLAPNLQVARLGASQYAITARGFNSSLVNKLLVLVDGRTIYTPLFSGVFWDAQDVMLEDVERIEVISGPGGAMWGSNAVNGVINILTRSSADTRGWLASAGSGNRESIGALRYGDALAGGGSYRVYAKVADRNRSELRDGRDSRDGFRRSQVGFRADWESATQGLTVQGDAYHGDGERANPGSVDIDGANVLARWTRHGADGAQTRVQFYVDRTTRNDAGTFRDQMNTVDLEFQHVLPPTTRQQFSWGAGYRLTSDRVGNSAYLAFVPANKHLEWANLYAQDEIALREHVSLTIGAKVETNVYTGAEFLPNVRLAWKPADGQLLWGELSRAVRAPARIDREFYLPGRPPFVLNGGADFESEVADVAQAGYRTELGERLSFSITAFHHRYDKLRSVEPGANGFVISNLIDGTANGAEAWASWRATRTWRLSAGANQLRQNLARKPGSRDPSGPRALGNDPRYQAHVTSSLDIGERHQLDLRVRRIGALPAPAVPAYTALDLRWGWRLQPTLELSLALQDICERRHVEFGDPATANYIERGAFLQLTWRP